MVDLPRDHPLYDLLPAGLRDEVVIGLDLTPFTPWRRPSTPPCPHPAQAAEQPEDGAQ